MRLGLGVLGVWVALAVASGCGGAPSSGAGALDRAGTPEALGQATQPLCADGPTVEGIDVSRYQGTINWAGVKAAGKAFAIIQAGRGLSPDPQFTANWAGAKANGIIRGTYLRFFPSQDVVGQADILIQANATASAANGDLPPMLDIEDSEGHTPAELRAKVQQLVNLVQTATGRVPLIYTGYYFWKDYVQSADYGTYPLVIPNYSNDCPMIPAGWTRWAFHQYSSTGKVTGITGNVDLDRWNGTLADLKLFAEDKLVLPVPDGGVTPVADGTLTGAIYESGNTQSRVQGATVTVDGKQQQTGADGLYKFTVAPGSHTVKVQKTGYTSNQVSRSVASGQTTWGSMNINPVATTPDAGVDPADAGTDPDPVTTPGLSGFAYDAETDARIAGASLVLRDGAGQVLGAAVTDAQGAFELDASRAPVVAQLRVSAEGYSTRTLDVTLEEDDRLVMDVALTALGIKAGETPGTPQTPEQPGTPGDGEQTEAPEGDGAAGCSAVPGLGLLALWVLLPAVRRATRR